MAAKYVSSQLIKNVQKGGQAIAVEFVDKTTAWTRLPGYPSASIRDEFVKLVEDKAATLKPQTTRVALKESGHKSPGDSRTHYTAYELDKDGKVVDVQHFVVDEKK